MGDYVGWNVSGQLAGKHVNGSLPHTFAVGHDIYINVKGATTLTNSNPSTNNSFVVLKNDGTASYIEGGTSIDVSNAWGVIAFVQAGSGSSLSLS